MAAWDLSVMVEELEAPPISISVTSDLHVGGVILKLVEKLQIKRDWSDHAMWWEQKQQWLLQTAWSLDKCGIQADARLIFMAQHKPLKLGLPNGATVKIHANFSSPVFRSVMGICNMLNLRHPEELSLLRPLEEKKKKKDKDSDPDEIYDLTEVPLTSASIPCLYNGMPAHFADSSKTQAVYKMLSVPLSAPAPEVINKQYRPASVVDKAHIHNRWLDSSRSLMQQGVQKNERLWLRFKYYSFHDLEPKYDAVRLTQLYEQARWAILLEDIDCTEEEMMLFGALQYHINKLALSEPQSLTSNPTMDDLDSALQCLEIKMEGESSTADMLENMTAPELNDYLKIFRPKRLTLKGYKQYWFKFKDTAISYYKSKEESIGEPIQQINLKGCEVAPDVNVAGQKFCIRLLIPSPEGMNEVYLRCENEHQYSQWMAACRLASKGTSLADISFESEMQSIRSFLAMQQTKPNTHTMSRDESINTHSLVSPRYHKKYKVKQLTPRILEAYQNVAQLSMTDALQRFLQIWQSLPDFGVSFFVVRFKGSRKDEVMGIAPNRLIRIDLGVGDVVKTWRYNNMRQWNVNWDIRQVAIEFDGNINIAFSCVTADCKIVHEFIGGYIFMSTRSREQSDTLNEELFHKLTGGHEAL